MDPARWRRLDATDVGFGYPAHRVITGVVVPPVDRLREDALELVGRSRLLARTIDGAGGRWRPVRSAALEAAIADVIGTLDGAAAGRSPEQALMDLNTRTFDAPLPFRIGVGDDRVHYSLAHAAMDGWSSFALLRRLLGAPGEPAWHELGPRAKDARAARFLAAHPGVVRSLFGYRAGTAQPAAGAGRASDAATNTISVVTSKAGRMDALRGLRSERWEGASFAGIVSSAVRAGLRRTGIGLLDETMVLFDVRRDLGDSALFGNWSIGMLVAAPPQPVAMSAAISAMRGSGLPAAALFAQRLAGSARRLGPVGTAGQRARLTYSHLPWRGQISTLPWRDPAEARLLRCCPTTDPGDISLSVHEMADRFNIVASFRADVWPRESVTEALQAAVEDTEGLLGEGVGR